MKTSSHQRRVRTCVCQLPFAPIKFPDLRNLTLQPSRRSDSSVSSDENEALTDRAVRLSKTRIQWLYVLRNDGEPCLHTVGMWFYGCNSQLFRLMLTHMTSRFDKAAARRVNFGIDGFQPISGMHHFVQLFAFVFIVFVEKTTGTARFRSNSFPLRKCTIVRSHCIEAFDEWLRNEPLSAAVRALVNSNNAYSVLYWNEVPLVTNSLVGFAGPHAVYSRDGKSFRTKRCVFMLNPVNGRDGRRILETTGTEKWIEAVQNLTLPTGYGARGQDADKHASSTCSWGWKHCSRRAKSHLLIALADKADNETEAIVRSPETDLLGTRALHSLRTNSYFVEMNAIDQSDVDIAQEHQLLRALFATVRKSCGSTLSPTSHWVNGPCETEVTWSTGEPIDLKDPWTFVRLLSSLERSSRKELLRERKLSDIEMWEASDMSPYGVDLEDEESDLDYSSVLESSLERGLVNFYYAPILYEVASKLVVHIASVWMTSSGSCSERVYFAPSRMTFRYGDPGRNSTPPHIDYACEWPL